MNCFTAKLQLYGIPLLPGLLVVLNLPPRLSGPLGQGPSTWILSAMSPLDPGRVRPAPPRHGVISRGHQKVGDAEAAGRILLLPFLQVFEPLVQPVLSHRRRVAGAAGQLGHSAGSLFA